MMNKRILELAKESGYVYHVGGTVPHFEFSNNQLEKFAELIIRECQDNLAWHGHDEAVSQLDWFKVHKLGIIL